MVPKRLPGKYVPVIVHAERYDAFEDAELVKRLVEAGYLLQAILYSLVRERDEQLKSHAKDG